MMQTKTVNGAKDILLIAENILRAAGRPRKPLGKPRPQSQNGKVSLVGAMTHAAKALGSSRTQLDVAFDAVIDAAWDATGGGFFNFGDSSRKNVQAYDDMELDTREVMRTLHRTIKHYL